MPFYTQNKKEVLKNFIYLINKIFTLLLISGTFILIHNSNILSRVNRIILLMYLFFLFIKAKTLSF